ncbi:MAG TPA: ESX secretion-associated protein EspG [Actinophytocola sp.]|uniref:ESX secretion-associated protein EspG n=1 Tax=Actinophytocola sp. TaxID=1872138 RepID=UPI002E087B02|nr:ESX secretion-associated protein EspG [Actinophytocola sp.]
MELPLPELDVLWEDLGLGDVPFPLEIPGHGRTLEERARIRAGVHDGLGDRGDAAGPMLRLLARPEVTVDLVAQLDGRMVRAVAAGRGRHAVRAVQLDRSVVLTRIRDTAVISSVVDLLPVSRPGPGRSVTLPVSALGRGARSGVLRPAGGPTNHGVERQLVASVMERPLRRVGQLGIMLRDDRGWRRLPGLAWLDTDQGRYASTVRRGPDGEDWTTLTPTDNAQLAYRLSEMLAAARTRVR